MRHITGLVLVAIIGAAGVRVGAETVTAASCYPTDVQAAMNRARPGDTIVIPAGVCRWTTSIEWNAPPNVTVSGAGTVIVDDYQSSMALMRITTDAAGTFRLANVTFQGGTLSSQDYTKYNGLITLGGSSKQLRVDHITCNLRTYNPEMSGRCIMFTGWLYGVLDHSVFELPNNTGQAVQVAHASYGDKTDGDGAWAAETAFGTDRFIFVEDNVFNSLTRYGTAQDCNAGGRFVWRRNSMRAASMQTHPTGGALRGRGCRAAEIYENSYTNAGVSESLFNVFFLSSGTAMIWGNTLPEPSEFKHFITLHAMRRNNSTYAQTATPAGWGYCGTSFNNNGSNWDGNNSAASGYPCLDQPGRGKGDLLSGSFPSVRNAVTGCAAGSPCAWPRQAAEPLYFWANRFTPMPGWGGSFAGGEVADVAPNRDWYADEGASCAAGGQLCATGVGVGARNQRPARCKAGTAWWSTDQGGNWNLTNDLSNDGTLDRCTATDVWSNAAYTPFTYPHPLASGSTILSAPGNVRVLP